MRIADATSDHLPQIVALNQEWVDVLAPLTRPELEVLHAKATVHRVALDDRSAVVGFLLAFGSETAHLSVNFRWFAARFESFLYVDRIVVAASSQARGVGTLLYRDLFALAHSRGSGRVTCEIDALPPNPRSDRFHDRFGFREVGTQQVEYVAGKPKRVSLRSVNVPSRPPSAPAR